MLDTTFEFEKKFEGCKNMWGAKICGAQKYAGCKNIWGAKPKHYLT